MEAQRVSILKKINSVSNRLNPKNNKNSRVKKSKGCPNIWAKCVCVCFFKYCEMPLEKTLTAMGLTSSAKRNSWSVFSVVLPDLTLQPLLGGKKA